MKLIEDDITKLKRLSCLLGEYAQYIRLRERQPLGSAVIAEVKRWVDDNVLELSELS